MVWAIDCRDYALALRLGRYVVRHGLTLPDNFNRTAATFLTEEMSKPVLTLAAADADADLSASTAVLDEVAEIVADSDMPDVVRAKLCKARALARRGATDITTKAEALALFREALTRNPNAGVKKEIATLAREVIGNLMDYGFVVGRPYLGVSTQDVSLSGYGFFTSTYTYPCIVSVEDGSAAQQAGLKKDDVIMAVNGDTVSSSDGLYIAVSKFKVGDTVTLTILRSNSQIDVSVTLGQRSTAKTAE